MSAQSEEAREYEAVKLQKSDQVKGLLEERHILDQEVKMVIYEAETTGEKLYQPEANRYLAKKRISHATFYVEYSIAEEQTYEVHTGYSHRAELEE